MVVHHSFVVPALYLLVREFVMLVRYRCVLVIMLTGSLVQMSIFPRSQFVETVLQMCPFYPFSSISNNDDDDESSVIVLDGRSKGKKDDDRTRK